MLCIIHLIILSLEDAFNVFESLLGFLYGLMNYMIVPVLTGKIMNASLYVKNSTLYHSLMCISLSHINFD